MWQGYLFPATGGEAVTAPRRHLGDARIHAGGTDLLVQLPPGEKQARCLADVSRIPGLEELVQWNCYPIARTLADHAVATIGHTPHEMLSILIGVGDPFGPYGARGAGEMPLDAASARHRRRHSRRHRFVAERAGRGGRNGAECRARSGRSEVSPLTCANRLRTLGMEHQEKPE
jgi:hypothetical protein